MKHNEHGTVVLNSLSPYHQEKASMLFNFLKKRKTYFSSEKSENMFSEESILLFLLIFFINRLHKNSSFFID